MLYGVGYVNEVMVPPAKWVVLSQAWCTARIAPAPVGNERTGESSEPEAWTLSAALPAPGALAGVLGCFRHFQLSPGIQPILLCVVHHSHWSLFL